MTGPLRVVIVDDEAPARERQAALLADHGDVVVAGDAADVAAAAELCRRIEPDVVFLDVQLRGESGFDLLPHLTTAPAIVFVTAHDAFAVRAFEVNALDYLLKPVHPARLAAALERVRASRRTGVAPQSSAAPPAPATTASPPLRSDDVVALRDDRGLRMVPLRRITHIESEENYTRVHVANQQAAFVRRSMADWLGSLPEHEFLRVSRTLIVQIAAVREVEVESRDVAHVHLVGQPTPLVVARRASARIRQALTAR